MNDSRLRVTKEIANRLHISAQRLFNYLEDHQDLFEMLCKAYELYVRQSINSKRDEYQNVRKYGQNSRTCEKSFACYRF